MALLIRNQAAFVEQISRNDQERLALQLRTEEWQRKGMSDSPESKSCSERAKSGSARATRGSPESKPS